MAVKDLSASAVAALAGTRDTITGLLYQVLGTTDWLTWLHQTLRHLSLSSMANLRVCEDDANATTIRILPGRCSNSTTYMSYAGGSIDLSANNNHTVYVWVYNSGGTATVGYGNSGSGWPGGAHFKLAEVVVASGAITGITDRRFDGLFTF